MDPNQREKLLNEYEVLADKFRGNGDNLCREDLNRLEALLKNKSLGIGDVTIRRLERKMKPCFERNNTYEGLLSLFQEAPLHLDLVQLKDLAKLHKQLHPAGQEALQEEIETAVKAQEAGAVGKGVKISKSKSKRKDKKNRRGGKSADKLASVAESEEDEE